MSDGAPVELEERGAERAWLIEGLWSSQGAGLLGAEPKCCKSWLALQMSVSVATGEPCLGRFAVPEPGPVLFFAAEDAEHQVRARVASIAATVGHPLETLNVTFLSVPELRLDTDEGRDLLRRCTEQVRPKLIVVDPFVRVTQADENSASGVGEVLQFLRTLQREFQTAVLLVHHMRKGGANMRPGQALRGSGDLHAFGDSNLYLARDGNTVLLTAEHRGAEGFEQLELELRAEGEKLALHALDFRAEDEPVERSSSRSTQRQPKTAPAKSRRAKRDIAGEVLAALQRADGPASQRQLRDEIGCRMEAVTAALRELAAAGRVTRAAQGYVPAAQERSHDGE